MKKLCLSLRESDRETCVSHKRGNLRKHVQENRAKMGISCCPTVARQIYSDIHGMKTSWRW